jgi:hypothetical protein
MIITKIEASMLSGGIYELRIGANEARWSMPAY